MRPVIDTLRFSDKLQEGGFTSKQADVLASAFGDELAERLATKDDVKVLKGEIDVLKGEIDVLKGEIDVLKGHIKRLDAKFNYIMALLGLLVALELIPVAGAVLG